MRVMCSETAVLNPSVDPCDPPEEAITPDLLTGGASDITSVQYNAKRCLPSVISVPSRHRGLTPGPQCQGQEKMGPQKKGD